MSTDWSTARGNARVARDVREALRGDARIPDDGLHARAEMIARTDLATAKTEASKARYTDAGVELVQWFATLDERTCRYCAARHGNAYKLSVRRRYLRTRTAAAISPRPA